MWCKMQPVDMAEIIGRSIRGHRVAAGITQRDLAHRLCVSPSTVWRWEVGRHMPSTSHLGAIADALELSADDFLKERK